MSSIQTLGRLALVLSSIITTALAAPSALEPRAATVAINFNTAAGASAAKPIPANAMSLSIEFCYITDFLGDVGKPNILSRNLLQNIQDRVGMPPTIRPGGDTQDNSWYCDTCSKTLVNTFSGTNTEAVNTTYNRNLFTVLNQNVPSKQNYIFGVNLKRNDVNIPKAEVAAAAKYFDPARLLMIELGNEPDYYGSYWRPGGWTITQYNAQIIDWIKKLNPVGGQKFGWQLGAFGSRSTSGGMFAGNGIINGGVPQAIGNAKQLSDHTYPFTRCNAAGEAKVSLQTLISHTHTKNYFTWWQPDVDAAHKAGLTFVMGETGSVSCHGKEGVSNTLGAALWMIDYVLNGVNMGMQGVYFHQGTGFFYSAWLPVAYNGSQPTVWPTYYAYLFVADVMQGLVGARVYEVDSLSSDGLAVYAVYVGGKVVRIVILNTTYWLKSSGTARPSVNIDVSTVLGKAVKVRRLTGVDTGITTGVSLAGQTFNAPTGLPQGAINVESVTNGVVNVLASEAVIIQL